MAALIDRRPGDLTDERMARQTDGELFWKITHGRSPMPAFEDFLTRPERWHLINFVRTLGPRPMAASAATPAVADVSAAPAPPAVRSVAGAQRAAHREGAMAGEEQEPAPITRQEYEDLLQQVHTMRAQIEALQNAEGVKPAPPNAATTETSTQRRGVRDNETSSSAVVSQPTSSSRAATVPGRELAQEILEDARGREPLSAGTTKFLVSGFAFAEFIDPQERPSTFSAGFAPVILWEVGDRLLFESELELTLLETADAGEGGHSHAPGEEAGSGGHSETVELTYAHFSYLLGDHLVVGGGKFLVPLGVFNERLHPLWINKLPVAPLAFDHHGGLVPHSDVGMYVRGGVPVGDSRFNYVAYLSNGPSLQSDEEGGGTLSFDTFPDANNNKAVGGRLGFLPLAEWELGYSVQYAGVATSGPGDADLLLQAVDVTYQPQVRSLHGSLEFRAEWVWSDLDVRSGEDQGGGGPILLERSRRLLSAGEHGIGGGAEGGTTGDALGGTRNGGYLQVSYRPTFLSSQVMRNFELVGRYDRLNLGNGLRDRRWTPGLNYWVTPTLVLKGAYQISEDDLGNTLFFQAVLAF